MMDQKTWLKSILNVISKFADKESQEQAWLVGKDGRLAGNDRNFPVPEELFCQFFDDFDAKNFIETNCLKRLTISKEQCLAIKFFVDELEKYGNQHGDFLTPEAMLKDIEWFKIRKLAKQVLTTFRGDR